MKKLNDFGAIERLTRAEMRNVKGGLVQPGGPGGPVDGGGGDGGRCSTASCTLNDNEYIYSGTCGSFSSIPGSCACVTVAGPYSPKGGTSHCVI
ncbi:hypothetical protein IDJ75_17630 [Mucilaginibacter rigui]|uniref:Bacteriocin n=2 Tax=Mucilaginibacter rigui TaxID=534635 RepID=A0ABR7X973_9SPHI|nr:hypothetical protein [Mucilaginibacter rigui]